MLQDCYYYNLVYFTYIFNIFLIKAIFTIFVTMITILNNFILSKSEPKHEIYIALGNYLAEAPEVMSLREGERLTVLETPEEGDQLFISHHPYHLM